MDDVRRVTLGGKARPVSEPPLGQVRRILKFYRQLAAVTGDDDAAAQERFKLVNAILAVFFGAMKLGRVTGAELSVFLNAVPDICGLEPAQAGTNTQDVDDFGTIYAHLAAAFGWDYATIDSQVKLSQLRDMSDYMKRNPPTHQLVAAYLGYEYLSPEEKMRRFFQQAISRN
ncbi:MAG: hypothetical protein PHR16_11750 [Methylovulum sp.]|nr:hypothetical protein [Methylovulum sp.]